MVNVVTDWGSKSQRMDLREFAEVCRQIKRKKKKWVKSALLERACPLDDPASFVCCDLVIIESVSSLTVQKCYNRTHSSHCLSDLVLALHRSSLTWETVVCSCSCWAGTVFCGRLSRWLNVCRGSLDRACLCVLSTAGINGCWAHSQRVRTAWPFCEQTFLLVGFEHVQGVLVKLAG